MAHSKTAFWMYNVETGDGKIFENESEFDPNEWVDTPAKTKLAAIDVKVVDELDRDALKAEALALGLEFPSNVKTDKLIAMIAEAK